MPLLLIPLRWAISSIIRLAILAGLLFALYLIVVEPQIEGGEQRVHGALRSLERTASPTRLKHCLGDADGDLGKIARCARIF